MSDSDRDWLDDDSELSLSLGLSEAPSRKHSSSDLPAATRAAAAPAPVAAPAPAPAPVAAAATPLDAVPPAVAPPSVRPRSVGSVVVGAVGRAPPRMHFRPHQPQQPVTVEQPQEQQEEALPEAAEQNAEAEEQDDDDAAEGDDSAGGLQLPSYTSSRRCCPLCGAAFDLGVHLPVLLHAGHSFCAACVQGRTPPSASASDANGGLNQVGSAVPCPVCNLVVPLPGSENPAARQASLARAMRDATEESDLGRARAVLGEPGPLAAFPVNFLLVERMQLERFAEEAANGRILCTRCDDTASSRCDQCDAHLCEFHVADHARSRDTRTHLVQSHAEYLTSAPLSLRTRHMCPAHPQSELDHVCLECEVPICVRCALPSGGTVHASPSHTHPTEAINLSLERQVHELCVARERAKQKHAACIRAMLDIQRVAHRIAEREQTVASQISAYFDRIHEAVEARKVELLRRLSDLVSSKNATLNMQNQVLFVVARSVEDATAEVDDMMRSVGVSPDEVSSERSGVVSPASPSANSGSAQAPSASVAAKLLLVRPQLSASLNALARFQPVALHSEETDSFSFRATPSSSVAVSAKHQPSSQYSAADSEVGEDSRLLSAIERCGNLSDSMAVAGLCTASGEGTHTAYVRVEACFKIQARDRFGQPKNHGGDPFCVEFVGPRGSASGRLLDHQNGTYSVRYLVLHPGVYSVVVSIHGRHIAGSPFKVVVVGNSERLVPGSQWITSIGARGTREGQLVSPMGVAAASDGTIVVSDYGNNRLSLFRAALSAASSGTTNASSAFTFLRCIGRAGNEQGALRNCWGVAIDPATQHLFVSDSANHRVQVFTLSGDFVRAFGSVGSAPGKFRHPAGIAIYTPLPSVVAAAQAAELNEGEGADAQSQPLSPKRGGASATGGSPKAAASSSSAFSPAASASSASSSSYLPPHPLLFVADREKHRIQMFDLEGRFVRLFGSGGSGSAQLLHPSGVAVDPRLGRVYVTDFSNSRVVVFGLRGEFLQQWGSRGSMPGQFLDPVGVAVDRHSRVYVADQLNHRVQVFESDGTFLRMMGQQGASTAAGVGTGVSSPRSPAPTTAPAGAMGKPAALCLVSVRADGSVVPLHEELPDEMEQEKQQSGDAKAPEQPSAGLDPNGISTTLVFVSDAATHKLHVYQ